MQRAFPEPGAIACRGPGLAHLVQPPPNGHAPPAAAAPAAPAAQPAPASAPSSGARRSQRKRRVVHETQPMVVKQPRFRSSKREVTLKKERKEIAAKCAEC